MGNGVRVPDYYYKVVYNVKLKQTLSFLVSNVEHCDDGDSDPENHIVDQASIEKMTGIKFFPKLTGYTFATKLW